MPQQSRHRTSLVTAAAIIAAAHVFVQAQQEPVASMFRADLKREQALAESFLPIETAAGAVKVYLSAGDLERAFDSAPFRPDAAIVPTNTALVITAASPTSQRVLVERVSKEKAAMADLLRQVEVRRKLATGAEVLQIGVDAFTVRFSQAGAFPAMACLIATDFATGGAVDRRELFVQDRMRKGVAACLSALDAAGAGSVMMPLVGAASAKTQERDPVFEGQRLLKECRQINSAAGIALGIHDFAATRKSIREIGIVQWDQDITGMFGGSRLAQSAYRVYAAQIKKAVSNGIAGAKTTADDLGGNCAATLSATPAK